MFSTQDIADYYEQTEVHYQRWWQLNKGLALHYGMWEKDTKTFVEALNNTRKTLAQRAGIQPADYILDAGCGIGGCAIFLAKEKGAKVVGITLSNKQAEYANRNAIQHQVEKQVAFQVQDYSCTSFEDETFDVVWACESVSSSLSKGAFIKEAYRVLKKGGRLVLSDYFLTHNHDEQKMQLIDRWIETWAISNITTTPDFEFSLSETGFTSIRITDETHKIKKSAKRMYHAYLLGYLPSRIYNIFHSTSRFAKVHYLSANYQYQTLRKGLWKYNVILAVK